MVDLRGTGRTTRQLETAPQGAVFVWHHWSLHYPQALAAKLGRPDIKIVSLEYVERGMLAGLTMPALVVDHFAWQTANTNQLHALRHAEVYAEFPRNLSGGWVAVP